MFTKSLSTGSGKYSFSLGTKLTVEFFIKVNMNLPKVYTLFDTGTRSASSQDATIAISKDLKIGLKTGGNCYGGPGDLVYSTKALTLKKTHHVAITIDTSSATYIYIDGELASTNLGKVTNCGKKFYGISIGPGVTVSDAPIGEYVQLEFPRIWNRILTTNEILESKGNKAELLEDQTDLIFYDTFEDGKFINRVDNSEAQMDTTSTAQTPIFRESILVELKALLKKNDKYYTYDGNKIVESAATSNEDIQSMGLDSLDSIPNSVLNDFLPFDVEYFTDAADFYPIAIVEEMPSIYNKEKSMYDYQGVVMMQLEELPPNVTKCIVQLQGKNLNIKTALKSDLTKTNSLKYIKNGDMYSSTISLTEAPYTSTQAYTKENPLCLLIDIGIDGYLNAVAYSWY